jgi:hypothetical protein
MTFRLEFISKCLALRPQIFRRLGEVADPSAGEARLTDKIIKGFFSKPPSFTPEFPFSIHMFLSLSLKVHMCIRLRARAKSEKQTKVFLGSEKRIQKCCEKFSFGDANCPRPLKKTFE